MQLYRWMTEQGGLLSYGPDGGDVWRRAVELIDKILRGTKPADIIRDQVEPAAGPAMSALRRSLPKW
jgi:ABC-type uncharacterized transport system substrate-binding protein